MSEAGAPAAPVSTASRAINLAARAATWLLALGCFYLVYTRIEGAAAREGTTTWAYVVDFFAAANWRVWLAIMIPYSIVFFLIDSHVTWRVIRWFNAPSLRFRDMLPIRASAYILSLVNEQVGKGAMTLYLLRRHKTPGWQTLSSMLLLSMMEIYQLLLFAGIGTLIYYDLVVAASTALPLNLILPAVMIVAFAYLPLHIAYFRGYLLKRWRLRDIQVLRAFREARPIHYLLIILFKAPNLLGGVIVYTAALALFRVDVGFGLMLAFLPVIFLAAALPLPFHAGSLVLWVVLFPDFPEVGVFSMLMHTFFVSFNALIGVVFLPIANRELFD